MEQLGDMTAMLDLMDRAAFCVKDGTVIRVNDAAKRLMIVPGTPVNTILVTGLQEYDTFEGGCLYLRLAAAGNPCGASVTRMGEYDIFRLEDEEDHAQLQAMALAARELRVPLSGVMSTADQLFPLKVLQSDPKAREQAARINRGLFQMLRVISNMSDVARYSSETAPQLETKDVTALLGEIFSKVRETVPHTGLTIRFVNLNNSVFSLVDVEKLERAVYNILSNAVKFTPAGGCIEAKLSQRGKMLYLTVQDSGDGIPEEIRGSLYSRYRRTPNLEDNRHGLGLGMVLVRSAAAIHGGTVLVDHPSEAGTRITMTLAVRQKKDAMVRSPGFPFDYAGGRDHLLLELSQCLPYQLYDPENIN